MPLLYGSFTYGVTLTGKGDYDEAFAIFERGLALEEKVGNEPIRHRLLNCLGWLYSELGDLDRALDLNYHGSEEARKRGDPETIANAELNLGDIFLAKGDLALAQEYFDGIDRLVNDPATSAWMKWRYSMHLFASLGELWLLRGDHARPGSSPSSAWRLPQTPTPGSIWSKAGASGGRSPLPAGSGTKQRKRSGRP